MQRRILVVDDEPDTLRTYSDILTAEGWEVAAAQTGEQALAMIDGYQPDVILLDIMLPGKDGIHVARELSMRGDARHIPIVVITALNSHSVGHGLADIPGIRRVIYKPCRPKTLVEGIEDAARYRH